MDWFGRTAFPALTGDGRPIGELRGGTRGEACRGSQGAVASTNYLATQAGLAVLAQGGNAADAAAAVQFMLGVAQPESNGIGGGAFILHYDANTREVVTIDGREEAPRLFHPHVFCADRECALDPECTGCPRGESIAFGDRKIGGLPVGVPGTLAATARLLREHGSGSWELADVMAPAVERARSGINMTSHLYEAIRTSRERLLLWNASAQLFLNAERTAPVAEVGEEWRNSDLADTYEQIAQLGVEEFYRGLSRASPTHPHC
jgi:gamma-glutamyltranspeptidase/glutathione hydrolase